MRAMAESVESFHWGCTSTWRQSAKNTFWCLVGCAAGDFGTVFAFQTWAPDTNPLLVLALAMMNGILTSIALETVLLARQMAFVTALKTAAGMSLISMIGMELAMNATDWLLVGSLRVTWWSLLPSLLAGFLAPWPYNYWRLKKFGVACH